MQRARLRSRRAPLREQRDDAAHHRRGHDPAKAPGPYAAITALQQSAGNRATGAAIAGKGTPVADGLLLGHTGDVQRAGGGGPTAGKSPASQAVDITTVAGPKDLGSGGFRWSVWFGIGAPAGAAGWVVQEINATLDGPGASTKSFHFWEAWEVEAGKKVTVWQDKGLDSNDDEYYVAPATTKKKGTNKVVGAVKFYEGPLPADFKKNNPSTLAGILHSTTTQPGFWDGSGTAHNITATWDDTGAAKVSNVEAQAGATRLKGTP